MADTTIGGLGTKAAPLDYKIPKSLELLPRSIKASFDGSGSGASYLPTLQVIADSGDIVGTYPVDTAVAAGASADVSWFPRLRRPSTAGGLGVCGETDVAPANPGIYLAAASNIDTQLVIPAATQTTETIACSAPVANGDYVVALVGVGSATRLGAAGGAKFGLSSIPVLTGLGFSPNPARNPSQNAQELGISGKFGIPFTVTLGRTSILVYASVETLSNAVINIGDTFRFDYSSAATPATDTLLGPRCYAVVGIPAATQAIDGTVRAGVTGGSANSSLSAEGFEYLIPAAGYTLFAGTHNFAHIYGLAVSAEGGNTDHLSFAGVQSVLLANVLTGTSGGAYADKVPFRFYVCVRMHRGSYGGACFRIVIPTTGPADGMPRWASAGTTTLMAASS